MSSEKKKLVAFYKYPGLTNPETFEENYEKIVKDFSERRVNSPWNESAFTSMRIILLTWTFTII